jgi:hypothetical protein
MTLEAAHVLEQTEYGLKGMRRNSVCRSFFDTALTAVDFSPGRLG